MNTIAQIAIRLGSSSSEVIEKLEILGVSAWSAHNRISPRDERLLRRFNHLSIDQMRRILHSRHDLNLNEPLAAAETLGVTTGLITSPKDVGITDLQNQLIQFSHRLTGLEKTLKPIFDEIDFLQKTRSREKAHTRPVDPESFEDSVKAMVVARSEAKRAITVQDHVETLMGNVQWYYEAHVAVEAKIKSYAEEIEYFRSVIERVQRVHDDLVNLNAAMTSSDQLSVELQRLAMNVEEAMSLSNDIEQLRERLRNTETTLAQSHELISSCEEDVQILTSRINGADSPSETVRAIQLRIEHAVDQSLEFDHRLPSPNILHLSRSLEAVGYLFSPDTLKQCVNALRRSWGLLLVGPAGTGKSTLARFLPGAFWPSEELKTLMTCHEANESWRSTDVYGGPFRIGDSIVPRLGVFTNGVVDCVEKNGRHWIFIDEVNRSDMDRAFAGVMSVLGTDPFESTFLNLPAHKNSIRVPNSFRLLCAMNDTDTRHLFPMSTAIESRFQKVTIGPPTFEVERQVVDRNLANVIEKAQKIARRFTNSQHSVSKDIERFLRLLEEIRGVGKLTGAHELSLGFRHSSKIIRSALELIDNFNGSAEDSLAAALMAELSSPLSYLTNEVLSELSGISLPSKSYQRLPEACDLELRRRMYRGLV